MSVTKVNVAVAKKSISVSVKLLLFSIDTKHGQFVAWSRMKLVAATLMSKSNVNKSHNSKVNKGQ